MTPREIVRLLIKRRLLPEQYAATVEAAIRDGIRAYRERIRVNLDRVKAMLEEE